MRLLCLLLTMIMFTMNATAFAPENTANTAKTNSYSSMSAKVNSAIDSAKSRITQLYDLDTALLQSYFDQAEAKLEELKVASGDTSALEAEIEELCAKIVMASAESRVVSARAT